MPLVIAGGVAKTIDDAVVEKPAPVPPEVVNSTVPALPAARVIDEANSCVAKPVAVVLARLTLIVLPPVRVMAPTTSVGIVLAELFVPVIASVEFNSAIG